MTQQGSGSDATAQAAPVEAERVAAPVSAPPAATAASRRQRFVAWCSSLQVVRLFAQDRPLLVAFVLLWLSAMAPMFVTPILPLVDMGVNIGAASLMNDVFRPGVIRDHYFLNPGIVPYWTVYSFMSFVEWLAGPFVAVKVTVGIALGLTPLSVMRLMRAFGRSPRLGLWAFLLTWDTNLYWGWITFQIGMALGLWLLAWLFESRDWKDALKALGLMLLVALTHIHAVALCMVVGGLLTFIKRPLGRTFLNHAIALSGGLLLLSPWLYSRFFPDKSLPKPGPMTFGMHPMPQKLGSLFRYTIDLIPPADPASPAGITTYAFVLILLGTPLFLLLRPRLIRQPSRGASAFFLIGAAGLYLLLPFEMWGSINHWWTYPRFGTYALIGVLLLPRPRLDGWRGLAVLPGIVCAFFLHRGIQKQFRDYGDYVRPYMDIIAALPRNKLLYPLDLDDYRFKGTYDPVLGQLHGYAAAAKSCFDPHLFDELNNPLRYRASRMPPVPNWFNQASFTMEREGRAYDYIVVHPKSHDIIGRNSKWRNEVELVKEAGPWRLYKVKR